MAAGAMMIASETFQTHVDGQPVTIHANMTLVDEGHELYLRFPQYFRVAESHFRVEVEQATAGPGEKRGSR